MNESSAQSRCPHGGELLPVQERMLRGEAVDAPRQPYTNHTFCRECWQIACDRGAEMAARHGVRAGEWEGATLQGRVRDITFSHDLGKFVVLFSPFGFATIDPRNVFAFEGELDGREKLADAIGEWWEIVFAEDGDVWMSRRIEPGLIFRFFVWLIERGRYGRSLLRRLLRRLLWKDLPINRA